jgi:hypothetical protein
LLHFGLRRPKCQFSVAAYDGRTVSMSFNHGLRRPGLGNPLVIE